MARGAYRLCWPQEDVTAILCADVAGPTSFCLDQSYPNPFNATATIEYVLPYAGEVRLTVYNLLGQRARRLVEGRQPAGRHRVTWDGTDGAGVASAAGVYVYALVANGQRAVRRMVLLK